MKNLTKGYKMTLSADLMDLALYGIRVDKFPRRISNWFTVVADHRPAFNLIYDALLGPIRDDYEEFIRATEEEQRMFFAFLSHYAADEYKQVN